MPEVLREVCSQIVGDVDQILCDPVDLLSHVLLIRTNLSLLVLQMGANDLLGNVFRLLLLEDRSDERVNFLRLLFGLFSRTYLAAPPASLLAHFSC